MRIWFIVAILLLTGCTSGTGVKWYAPGTWFSGAAGSKVDSSETKLEDASTKAVKAAQKSAHETKVALLTVPESRSTEVATQTNDNTVSLLDQVAGPLSSLDLTKIKDMISGLVSENTELRAKAEREWAQSQKNVGEISKKLQNAQTRLGEAQEKLRVAFERENELANQLRAQRALFWIAAIVGTLGFLGWMYVRLTLGGLPTALGRSLNTLRADFPNEAAKITQVLDVELSPIEQNLIRIIAAKHK